MACATVLAQRRPVASSRTAREFGQISGERLRSESDALGHRQVRAPQVGDLMHGHAVGQRVHCRRDDVTSTAGDSVCAEQATGIRSRDEFDETTGVPVDQGPWHVLQWECPACAAVALLDCVGFGQASRRDGRAGECDPWQMAVVQPPVRSVEGVVHASAPCAAAT